MSSAQSVLPAGRTLQEFKPLLPAEQKLLAACRAGEIARITDTRPGEATADNTVRAAFIRFLALGGDHAAPVHEKGIQLGGAWITGMLDLEGATVLHELWLIDSHFDIKLVLRGTKLQGSLGLPGSELPGLEADGLVCSGGIFMRENFRATGEIRLLGAQIGGDLLCGNGSFDGVDGCAMSCDRAAIKGSVFMHNGFRASGEVRLLGAQIGGNLDCGNGVFAGKDGAALSCDGAEIKGSVCMHNGFKAGGEVRLLGAQIGGDLDCENGSFAGEGGVALSCDQAAINGSVFMRNGFNAIGRVRLLGTQIGGDLDCGNGSFDNKDVVALSCDGMSVSGAFIFRELERPGSNISLNHVNVGQLVDDATAWGEGLILDGFSYGSIAGGASTDAKQRLAWLDKQPASHCGQNGDQQFRPQPWRQLQKVLREMGHAEDARQVAIAFEKRQREIGLIGQTPPHWWRIWAAIYRWICIGFHWTFGVLVGYGYRPLKLLAWMAGVWLFCAVVYWYAALSGIFGPSNPLVILNPELAVCAPSPLYPVKPEVIKQTKGAGNWYLCEKLPEEYTGFSPLAYSLDVILPLVDLQQEKDWSPLIPTPEPNWLKELINFDLKHLVRLVLWIEILFGWLASLLLVAVVSGLTKRRED